MQPVAALTRQQERRHGIDRQSAVALLEDRPDIDDRVDVVSLRGVSHDGGLRGRG